MVQEPEKTVARKHETPTRLRSAVVSLSACSLLAIVLSGGIVAQTKPSPSNGQRCEQCHGMPSRFGSSPLTVQRVGNMVAGKFIPGVEGGVLHRNGSSGGAYAENQLAGERVSLSLLGDGYIEAIADQDIERNAREQRRLRTSVAGQVVAAPVLESRPPGTNDRLAMRPGRFGWKSQHATLTSACADSLRNELGIRNRLYPDEYANHQAAAGPTPLDTADPTNGETELQQLVEEIRRTSPPERDRRLARGAEAQAGEKLFAEIGCALCHVATYKTLRAGTLINGGTYSVTSLIGDKTIHPYSDFLLHDIGTGDRIPQAAIPELLDQSTAMEFRTPALWGLRFRSWMMHDGKSKIPEDAIKRHAGEATEIRKRYERLTSVQKAQVQSFLNSL